MSDIIGIENIVEYIRTVALPKIDGTGDYNQTVKTITRIFSLPHEIATCDMPFIYISNNDDGCKVTEMTGCELTMGSTIVNLSDGYPIDLIAYLKTTTAQTEENNLDKQLNYMQSDMVRAMMSDITFGGLINSVQPVAMMNKIIVQEDEVGIAFMKFMLKFDFNPYT